MANTTTLEVVEAFSCLSHSVEAVALSADEQLLAVLSNRPDSLSIYNTSSGEQKWSAYFESFQAVFSPEGSQVAASDYNGNCIKIFTSEAGTLLRTLSGHTAYVCGVAWSSAGIVASASGDTTVRLWNPEDGTCMRTLSAHSNSVYSAAFSPDGTRLASGGADIVIRIWDVASGTCLHGLTGHAIFIWRVAFSPDGCKLASSSGDGTVRIWSSSSNFNCVRILAEAGGGNGPSIAWSPDSLILATTNETSLQLWDESGASILQAQNQASALIISRFSHEIITGSKDGEVKRWRSPITWSLFFDLKNGISFGKLPLPPKSSHEGYAVSETLERISTIIERMDPPAAFHKQIKLLHELNTNSSFVSMQARAGVVRNLEQGFGKLIDQWQSLSDAQTSLRQKASRRRPLAAVKEDLVKLESSSHFFSCMKKYLNEYFHLPTSEEKEISFKQYEHSTSRDLPENELENILSFAHISHGKLERLEKVVINTAKQFEKALLDYDHYSAEIREQSEKNIDVITAFLAYRPSTSISSERIAEIEKVISELRVILDNDRDITSKLDRSLADLSSAKDQLHKNLEEQRSKKEQIEMQAALERSARDSAPAQPKGGRWIQKLKGVVGKAASAGKESTNNIHQQEPPPLLPAIEVDDNSEHLRQQLEQAKSNLKSSTAGIEQHAHIVYKWLNDHPDAKLDAGEVFDIIGIR